MLLGLVASASVLAVVTGMAAGPGLGGGVRASDVVAVVAVGAWWSTGGPAAWSGRTRAVIAGCLIGALGAMAVRDTQDVVLLARVGLVPVQVDVARQLAARMTAARIAGVVHVVTAGVAVLILLPAVLNLGSSSVMPSAAIDEAYDAWYPRADSGFVYTSGDVIRSRGPFSHPNEAGGVIAVLSVVSMGLARTVRSHRLLPTVSTGLGLLAVVATGSRSSVVAVLCGAAAFFVLGLTRRGARGQRVVRASAVVIAALGAAAFASSDPGAARASYSERLTTISNAGSDQSFAGRLDTLSGAGMSMLTHPLGTGIELFNERIGSAHNSLLFIGATFGLPLAIWVGAWSLRVLQRCLRTLGADVQGARAAVGRALASGTLTWLVLALTEDRPESAPTMALLALLVGVSAACQPPDPSRRVTWSTG